MSLPFSRGAHVANIPQTDRGIIIAHIGLQIAVEIARNCVKINEPEVIGGPESLLRAVHVPIALRRKIAGNIRAPIPVKIVFHGARRLVTALLHHRIGNARHGEMPGARLAPFVGLRKKRHAAAAVAAGSGRNDQPRLVG